MRGFAQRTRQTILSELIPIREVPRLDFGACHYLIDCQSPLTALANFCAVAGRRVADSISRLNNRRATNKAHQPRYHLSQQPGRHRAWNADQPAATCLGDRNLQSLFNRPGQRGSVRFASAFRRKAGISGQGGRHQSAQHRLDGSGLARTATNCSAMRANASRRSCAC